MFTVNFDDSDLQKGLDRLTKAIDKESSKALGEMADTLLLISREEVPHDEGTLQASGHTFMSSNDEVANTAYNTPYAAFQHEGGDGKRFIRHWQKGRKKKYLEDPLKMNLSKWLSIYQNRMQSMLSSRV